MIKGMITWGELISFMHVYGGRGRGRLLHCGLWASLLSVYNNQQSWLRPLYYGGIIFTFLSKWQNSNEVMSDLALRTDRYQADIWGSQGKALIIDKKGFRKVSVKMKVKRSAGLPYSAILRTCFLAFVGISPTMSADFLCLTWPARYFFCHFSVSKVKAPSELLRWWQCNWQQPR